MNESTLTLQSKFKGEILRRVYRVWLFRKLIPVLVLEIAVLAIALYVLGQTVFIHRIVENGLGVLISNPPQFLTFIVGAFAHAPVRAKILIFVFALAVAFLLRHLTQGFLRLILVRENYFERLKK